LIADRKSVARCRESSKKPPEPTGGFYYGERFPFFSAFHFSRGQAPHYSPSAFQQGCILENG